MKKGITLSQYMILVFTLFGVLLVITVFPIMNSSVEKMEEHLIGDRLISDIHYIEDLIGDGDWNIKGDFICRGDVAVGDGTKEHANLEPFLLHEEKTGTFSYVFIKCGDEGLTYVEDTPTQAGYQQGHFLRVAGSTRDPNGESIVGTYMDKLVADILDEHDTYDGEANVAGGMIYCRYDTLKDKDGNVIGAIVVGRSIEELRKDVSDTTRSVIRLGLAVIILGSLLLILLVNRWVQAFGRATDHVQKIEKGIIPEEKLMTTNLREADILSQGINSLADTLRENEELRIKSETDELTGLHNRFGMNHHGYELFDSCIKNGETVSVGMLDIDYFKAYNDNYGHQAGDDCIVRVADVLRRLEEEGKIFAVRYGGDEFIIITHGLDQDGVYRIADEIRERVNEIAIPHAYSKISSCITVSQGHYLAVPKSGNTLLDYLTAADAVMYKVKSGSKNNYRIEQEQSDSGEDRPAMLLQKDVGQSIEWSSYHDYLTQLFNREGFYKEVAGILKNNPDKEYYMVRSNIRNFKLVNQLFGYDKGNEILVEIADVLRNGRIVNEAAGRIHGDQFAFLIEKNRFDEKRILECFREQSRRIEDSEYVLQFYIGVYEITDKTLDVSIMCDRANIAISSGNHDPEMIITYYQDHMMDSIIKESYIIAEFDRALELGNFKVFLQPILNSAAEVVSAEALVRWYDPETESFISPGDFIETLENAGLIYKLDLFVWEEAAQLLGDWKGTPMDAMSISVNVSPLDAIYVDIAKTFENLANKYDIDPSRLNIEFTETTLISDVERYNELITSLHDKGFKVEIDDFGTGYSSLNMLRTIKTDVLKIDKAFLDELETVEKSRSILEIIVDMSKRLSMTVIAEGVETKMQVDYLKGIGCDLFQGFFFSKPIPVKEFVEKYF